MPSMYSFMRWPPRRSGAVIRGDYDARRGGNVTLETKLREVPVAGEQAPPGAHHDRVDEEDETVDEIMCQERLHEPAAPEHYEVLARPLLQPRDGPRDVSRNERRILPRQRLRERRRDDVLGRVVE